MTIARQSFSLQWRVRDSENPACRTLPTPLLTRLDSSTVNRLPSPKMEEQGVSLSPTVIVRESLGPRVAAGLRQAIVIGDLPAGERLIEADLAERYGVSRGPVRDAFRILQAEGLVESRRQGVVVTGIGSDDINELYSLRGTLEALAVRLVMKGGETISLSRLESTVRDMERAADAKDPEEFGLADIDFHNEICALSGHRRLTDVWQQYKEIMMTLLRLTVFLHQNLEANAAKHRELFDLIKVGDPIAAEAELANHLEGSRLRMVTVWEQALERRRIKS